MIRRPPRSTQSRSSAASDVYKRQYQRRVHGRRIRKEIDLRDPTNGLSLLANKALWALRRARVQLGPDFKGTPQNLMESDCLIAVAKAFLDYMIAHITYQDGSMRFLDRPDYGHFNKHMILYCTKCLMNDIAFLLELNPESIPIIEEGRKALLEDIEPTSLELLRTAEFDNNSLFSIVTSDPKKFYNDFHTKVSSENPRNNPDVIDEVHKMTIQHLKNLRPKL
eukprot:TRINITY_DN6476_c0_g1_i1.p1 TRINITY_DN6476_c0_g1~~TRINITY_DN6476_c0_g1_i1.p1  ORF type:complete len:223 (-),score=37.09 TRINITY_DN6476_c0_g1_i1:142-810(-)